MLYFCGFKSNGMERRELVQRIFDSGSYLCVGLDSDISRIPKHLLSQPDPVFTFNKHIIDATKEHCVAYKINTAFYESMGLRGWETLMRTVEYIPDTHFRIADAKRGDIGNTSDHYARTFFDAYPFDAVTVAPYMGQDSVSPFLAHKGKWTILLGLTSNPGSSDFQLLQNAKGEALYEHVLRKAAAWAGPDQLMFVVGATQQAHMAHVRSLVPDHFFLVPGVGAQGGDLEEISRQGFNAEVGLLVNVSRGILFASQGEDFPEAAMKEASGYHTQMKQLLKQYLPR